MLASEVIDRTYSTWLHPAGINLPAFDTLSATMLVGATSFTVNGLQSYIPQGLVEIESELILTKEPESTNTVDVNERGFWETAAAEHASGTKVWIDPTFPRKVVMNALDAVIASLYAQGIYQRASDTDETWTDTTYKELPTGGMDIESIVVLDELSRPIHLQENRDYEVFTEYEPARYVLYGGWTGRTLRVNYKKDFTPLATEADNLTTTVGIPLSLQPHLPMAVAGYLLQGREVANVEALREQFAAQGVQVGQAFNIGQALLRAFDRYVANERNRLLLRRPTRTVV